METECHVIYADILSSFHFCVENIAGCPTLCPNQDDFHLIFTYASHEYALYRNLIVSSLWHAYIIDHEIIFNLKKSNGLGQANLAESKGHKVFGHLYAIKKIPMRELDIRNYYLTRKIVNVYGRFKSKHVRHVRAWCFHDPHASRALRYRPVLQCLPCVDVRDDYRLDEDLYKKAMQLRRKFRRYDRLTKEEYQANPMLCIRQ